jgi:hypothetical protein
LFEVRRVAGVPRAMPNFIVIGAQKSGTSSMFAYLRQHPQIIRPIFKELYYFDRNYQRGLDWYGCNFPASSTIARRNDRHGRPHLTFEATATYIFDAQVPTRIAKDIETRKFIVLLRDPVDRAISAYWHARRMGRETRERSTSNATRPRSALRKGAVRSPSGLRRGRLICGGASIMKPCRVGTASSRRTISSFSRANACSPSRPR